MFCMKDYVMLLEEDVIFEHVMMDRIHTNKLYEYWGYICVPKNSQYSLGYSSTKNKSLEDCNNYNLLKYKLELNKDN